MKGDAVSKKNYIYLKRKLVQCNNNQLFGTMDTIDRYRDQRRITEFEFNLLWDYYYKRKDVDMCFTSSAQLLILDQFYDYYDPIIDNLDMCYIECNEYIYDLKGITLEQRHLYLNYNRDMYNCLQEEYHGI